ncbi:hypothetical protein R1flu_011673 [Riccia fluitans]|uniref:Pentatricopeptide repeat-containing protein n=1 Tax=Riccia fluitans TaxID=41844 RepID=A0ABD1Z8U6_9MARC
MVRGSRQLGSWFRALGGYYCEKLRRTGGSKYVSSDIQLLTSSCRDSSIVEGNVILVPRQELSSAACSSTFHGQISRIAETETRIGKDISIGESLKGNSAWFSTAAGSDTAIPPSAGVSASSEERPTAYRAPARFPGAPDPKPKNDRYFRAGNNSTVSHMLKLLEAAPSDADVEKILEDRIGELAESKRWPWLPLLDALQKGPKPYLALDVFNWKVKKFDGGDPKEYAKMISTAGRLNQLGMATTLFKEMEGRGIRRTPVTCNALISAYSKNNQTAEAIALFKEMQESADCKPTLVTYNTLISMFSKLSVKDMETYFDASKEAGLFPDRVTYNSMIWGYMRGGLFDKMEEVYGQLVNTGCKPDPITFSALIIGFSKAGSLEKMESAFHHMQEEGYTINNMIAEIMVEFYAAERQFEKMERIMKIVSNTPGTSCSSMVYGLAIQAYAETGRIEQMEQTIEKMFGSRRLFTTSKVLDSVIAAYAEKHNFEGLEKLLVRVKSLGWLYQLTTFHTLIYEYGRTRLFDKMEDIFEEMSRSTEVRPTAQTYQLLADSYNAAGDEEMVLRTADRMRAAGFDSRPVMDKEVDRVWTDDEIFDGKRRAEVWPSCRCDGR